MSEQVKQLWSVLTAVLTAIRGGGLEASVTLKRLIGQADRQLKRLIDGGESALANAPPVDLVNSLLYYVARAASDDPKIRELREKYNLDDTSTGVVTKDDIEDVVARWTGVPMTAIREEEVAKLLRIEEELHKRVVSQEKAISALARAIRRSRAASPAKPPS